MIKKIKNFEFIQITVANLYEMKSVTKGFNIYAWTDSSYLSILSLITSQARAGNCDYHVFLVFMWKQNIIKYS